MDNFTATMICEGVYPATEEEQHEAWQHLIDTGLCWVLQGWFGRRARDLIETGVCQPYPRPPTTGATHAS